MFSSTSCRVVRHRKCPRRLVALILVFMTAGVWLARGLLGEEVDHEFSPTTPPRSLGCSGCGRFRRAVQRRFPIVTLVCLQRYADAGIAHACLAARLSMKVASFVSPLAAGILIQLLPSTVGGSRSALEIVDAFRCFRAGLPLKRFWFYLH
jgi:hypothetical protein